MGKLKDDFISGTEEQKIKFCSNLIEEYSFEGKSKAKINEELKKIGADETIIQSAYEVLRDEYLPSEIEKAKKIIEENFVIPEAELSIDYSNEFSMILMKERQKQIRRMLNKLAYLKFDEDTILEIAEGFY